MLCIRSCLTTIRNHNQLKSPNSFQAALSGQIATFAINTELNDPFNANAPVLRADGLPNSLNPADTVNITVEGDFHGIAKAYADPTITTCASAVPAGSITGTVTTGSLTFNSVKINTPVQICMIPDGVNQLDASTQPYNIPTRRAAALPISSAESARRPVAIFIPMVVRRFRRWRSARVPFRPMARPSRR
jgi:hypothetical protein